MRPVLAPEPDEPVARAAVPRFSVIVAAYEAAGFIHEALASALAQTVPPHEIIVCDDGSADDLTSALGSFGDRIRLVWQPHAGEPAAKNTAAAAATGDYIVILDSDDVWSPERLEALGELASARPDLDIINTDAYVQSQDRIIGRFNGEWNPFPVADQRSHILERCFVFSHAAVKRERYLAAGGFDPVFAPAADWDCWIRMIFSGAKAGSVDEPLASYRLRPGSMTANRAVRMWARVKVLETVRDREQLTESERAVLRRSRAHHLRRALLAEAEAALTEQRSDARRRCLAVARGPGFGWGTRARALAASLAPGLARRRLAGADGAR